MSVVPALPPPPLQTLYSTRANRVSLHKIRRTAYHKLNQKLPDGNVVKDFGKKTG
jgi:hypothetical protein